MLTKRALHALSIARYHGAVPQQVLRTSRLQLVPVKLEIVEAVLSDRLDECERLLGAKMPQPWPGRALIERAFSASLEGIRADPVTRLWGDRIAITLGDDPRVIGSVVFHGKPTPEGVVEVGYGIEMNSQGLGLATEAVGAQVEWAFTVGGVRVVRATTPPWHKASVRVLEKCGFHCEGPEEHENLGEVLVFVRSAT